jgi:hypothetical protein
MSDIFISYAREDRNKAELLAHIFEQQKWTVWWDKVIPPGGKYADVIGAELGSAKAVIVLWSAASVASDWVKDEAQEGINRKNLVPALISKVSPPYGFRQVQTADLSEWDGSPSDPELQSLLRSVAGLISKPISEIIPSNRDNGSGKRLSPILFVVAGVLVLLLGFAAFKFFGGGPANNQNQFGNFNQPNTNARTGDLTPCDSDSRHKAAGLTGTGLTMIDPGGNQAAAVLQFNEAITECSSYADAYFWRGQSFVALQQNEKAVTDFKKFLELTSDADSRQQAEKFIADLEGPRPTPVPTAVPANTNTNTNTAVNVNTNFNTNTKGPSSPTPTPAKRVQPQVTEIFDADKSKRIGATTRLIIEKKHDTDAVKQSVNLALQHPENKSGVINTLVFLENVDPVVLKQNRAEIEKLLKVSQANGGQTAAHVAKVQALLNN